MTTLRTVVGSAFAVATLAAVLTGCDGSGYVDSGYVDSGYVDSEGFDTGTGFESEQEGGVVFSGDGDSLTTLPGGEIVFSGSDGSSFSTG